MIPKMDACQDIIGIRKEAPIPERIPGIDIISGII
jgi:hypothetical protein